MNHVIDPTHKGQKSTAMTLDSKPDTTGYVRRGFAFFQFSNGKVVRKTNAGTGCIYRDCDYFDNIGEALKHTRIVR